MIQMKMDILTLVNTKKWLQHFKMVIMTITIQMMKLKRIIKKLRMLKHRNRLEQIREVNLHLNLQPKYQQLFQILLRKRNLLSNQVLKRIQIQLFHKVKRKFQQIKKIL
jgi:hypothetical protein